MGVGTYYSDQYTDKYIDVPPSLVEAGFEGKVTALTGTAASLTATGLDAASTFTMFRPPQGYRFLGLGALWSDADLTNNVTMAVGTGATTYARSGLNVDWDDATPASAVTDAFLAATNHGGGAATKTVLATAAAADYVGYEFDGDTNVVITTAVGAMATGVNITLVMLFAAP